MRSDARPLARSASRPSARPDSRPSARPAARPSAQRLSRPSARARALSPAHCAQHPVVMGSGTSPRTQGSPHPLQHVVGLAGPRLPQPRIKSPPPSPPGTPRSSNASGSAPEHPVNRHNRRLPPRRPRPRHDDPQPLLADDQRSLRRECALRVQLQGLVRLHHPVRPSPPRPAGAGPPCRTT